MRQFDHLSQYAQDMVCTETRKSVSVGIGTSNFIGSWLRRFLEPKEVDIVLREIEIVKIDCNFPWIDRRNIHGITDDP